MTTNLQLRPKGTLASTSGLSTVVLLAGRVGPGALGRGVQRSVLDLPLGDRTTILGAWASALNSFAITTGTDRLRVMLAIDTSSPSPRVPSHEDYPRLRWDVLRDLAEYRGTAGVVKDAISGMEPSTRIVVATASQIPVEPLASTIGELNGDSEGVSLVSHRGSDVASCFVLRCDRFDGVPEIGFVDLKEQVLGDNASGRPLRVVGRAAGALVTIRSREDYLQALRTLHATSAIDGVDPRRAGANDEGWQPRFAIIEEGASVDRSAVIQDSVVLAGGVVEADAIVARSVVCPGGVVRRRSQAIDRVVAV